FKDLLFCGICGRKLNIHKKSNGTLLIMPCRKEVPDSDIKCNNQGVKLQSLEEEVLQQLQNDPRLQWDQHLQPQEKTSILIDLHERLLLIEQQLRENAEEQAELIEPALARELPYKLLKRVHTRTKQHPILQESRAKIRKQIQDIAMGTQLDMKAPRIGSFEHFTSLPAEQQNEILKQRVKRIYYVRVMPEEIRELPARSPEREAYPFHYTIEYF
ncbi:zinc ribbon domain-containing protein, partial [Paenibacillus medicaginis]